MPEITMTNFPPSGAELEMRTIILGPRGPMRLIMDVDANEAGDDLNVDLTVSNAVEHSELKEFLTDMIELLQYIVEDTDFDTSVVRALEEKQAELEAVEEYPEAVDEQLPDDYDFEEDE